MSVLITLGLLFLLSLRKALANVDVKNKKGCTPLFYAQHMCVAKALVEAGANV